MRRALVTGLAAVAFAAAAGAQQYVLPLFAFSWPGKGANRWVSQVFLVNPGPTAVAVRVPRFLPGVLKEPTPCYPPIAASVEVAPYATRALSTQDLSLDLQCPEMALGGLLFDANGPIEIVSEVVNVGIAASPVASPSGFGQDVPGFGPADLAIPGATYQLPALVWDPNRCGHPPLFEVYLYLANPGDVAASVVLQQSHKGSPGVLIVNGVTVATPYTFKLAPQSALQLKVDLGGAIATVCLPPRTTDLFFITTQPIAVVASVVDRSSQDARTVLPVKTTD
ncbi:MAG: hypothetical protein ACHQQS_06760 [Thermoanaerobaculales bacterium]